MDKREELEAQAITLVESDNAFTRKARLLQTKKRKESGALPGFRGTRRYGNLAEDGLTTNRNFLNEKIFNYAKYRVATKEHYETIAESRMFCNFLSSQPMAFNLFYPMMDIIKTSDGRKRLAKVVSNLLDKENSLCIDEIKEVGLEFIPDYYKDCLNDKTAMDACFRYVTTAGKKGIIAIETKYTDCLGTNEASNVAPAREAAKRVGDLFKEDALKSITEGRTKMTQVYRNFLLTEMVRLYEGLDESLSIVLAPKENTSNKADEKALKDSLVEDKKYKFQVLTLETFVEAMIEAFPEESIFEEFRKRYLEFE